MNKNFNFIQIDSPNWKSTHCAREYKTEPNTNFGEFYLRVVFNTINCQEADGVIIFVEKCQLKGKF